MRMSKNILIVNWGTLDKVYPFKVAKQKGLTIFLATSRNYPDWIIKYVRKENIIITNTYKSTDLISDTLKYIRKNRIVLGGITTFFELNIYQTADLAYALGFQFLSPEAARNSSINKLLMKLVCINNGIKMPAFHLFRTVDEGHELLDRLKLPVVIKPITSGHSFGTIKVNTKNEFRNHFSIAQEHLKSRLDEWMDYYDSHNQDFIMEEYVEGPTVSIDGLIQNGKAYVIGMSDFIMSSEPIFMQKGVRTPPWIPPALQAKCINETKRVLKALKFDNCGFHCEMKVTKKSELVFLEAAARPPGGNMLENYKLASGIDFASLYIDLCMGNKIKLPKNINKTYVLENSFLPPAKYVAVKKIDGLKEISRLKSIRWVNNFTPKGSTARFKSSFPENIIHYLVCSKDLNGLKRDCQKIEEVVNIVYSDNLIYYYYCYLKERLNKLSHDFKRYV
jgi:biotin carboxylase